MTNSIHNIMTTKFNSEMFEVIDQWKKGQIISGKVIDITNSRIKINFDSKEISMNITPKVIEQIGDSIQFEIKEITKGQMKLKYIPKNEDQFQYNSATMEMNPFDIIEKSNSQINDFKQKIQDVIHNNTIKNEKELMDMAIKLRKDIENIASKVTEKDIKKLIDEQYNPEKVSIDIISRVVNQNKKAVMIEDYESLFKDVEAAVEVYKGIFNDDDHLKQMVTSLKKFNLPVNKKNISKIQDVLSKFKSIHQLSNESMANILKHNKALTIENIYKAQYMSTQDVEIKESIHELEPQIINILDKEGMGQTQENIQLAKLLISSDVPLSKVNLEKIESIKNGIEYLEIDTVIEEAVEHLALEQSLGDILILSRDKKTSVMGETVQEDIINHLPQISKKHIDYLIIKDKVINLHNLIQEIKDGAMETNDEIEKNMPEDKNLKAIKAQLAIEEIRLKMTLHAANDLSEKGLDIDVEPVEKVVEGLRALEREEYTNYLKTNGVEASKENVDKIVDVYEKVTTIRDMPYQVMLNVVEGQTEFTIKDMAADKTSIDNALQSYDTLGTQPRRDLGDSLEKAFKDIEHILEDLNIEITEKNIRAAKILGMHAMEISEENIEAIKIVDIKVRKVTEHLHPNIVVNMIKDNFSPIEMHVDEVLQYMDNFDELLGKTDYENIIKSIYELDLSHDLTPDERQSLIGIYRMLTTVSKSKGAAVGFLVKNNMTLSLNNLFEASKYLKKIRSSNSAIEASIDDDFGMLNVISYDKKSIKEQIRQAINNNNMAFTPHNVQLSKQLDFSNVSLNTATLNKAELMNLQLEAFLTRLDSENLEIMQKNGHLDDKNIVIEDLLEQMSLKSELADSAKEWVSKLQELPLTIETLKSFERYHIPKTINNLEVAGVLSNNPHELVKSLNGMVEDMGKYEMNPSKLHNLINRLMDGNLAEDYESTLNELKEHIQETRDELLGLSMENNQLPSKAFQSTTNIIEYQKALIKEDYYQIPIIINGEMTQLNMYYLNERENNALDDNEDSMKIYLYFNTKHIDNVQAYINIEDNNMEFSIYTANQEDLELLESFGEELKSILSSTKYNIGAVNYSYFIGESPINESIKNESDKDQSRRHSNSKFEVII